MDRDKVPKRTLLKLGFIAAAAAVATRLPFDISDLNPSTENEHSPFEVLKLKIGKLDTTILLTEHDSKATRANYQKIIPYLQDPNQIVIPEYMPFDYLSHVENNPKFIEKKLKDNYLEANSLFTALEKYLLTKEMADVRVVDPAYSNASIVLRLENNWPFAVDTLLIDALLAEDIIHRYTHKTRSNNPLNDSKTILELMGIGLNTSVGTAVTQFSKYGTETILRRVFVARALKQLGNQVEQDSKATIIYPSGHWHGDRFGDDLGIKHFLADEKLLDSFFDKFSRFKQARHYQDLYQTRKYVSKNGQWEKLPGFEII